MFRVWASVFGFTGLGVGIGGVGSETRTLGRNYNMNSGNDGGGDDTGYDYRSVATVIATTAVTSVALLFFTLIVLSSVPYTLNPMP